MFSLTEVAAAIRGIKSGEAAGEDEIQSEMLKALNKIRSTLVEEDVSSGEETWRNTKRLADRCDHSYIQKAIVKSVRIIEEYHFLAFLGKMYAKCLERKCREMVESKLEDGQCGFCPRRSTTEQIFTLTQVFEKSWEFAKDVFACFVDL